MTRRGLIPAFLTLALSGLFAPAAFAQDTRAQEERIAKLEKEIAVINDQLKQTSDKSSSALSNLNLLRKKISNRRKLIDESDRKIFTINRSIAGKEAEIGVLQKHLDTLSYYYSRLVRTAYKNRDSRVWYMYILASDNVGQAFRRLNYLRNFSVRMNAEARKIAGSKAQLEADKASLVAMRAELEATHKKRLREVRQLNSEEKESQQVVARLNRDKQNYQKQLEQKRRQVDALNREIAEIIRKATEQKGGKKASSAADAKLSSTFAANKGRLPWPVDGTVVDSFGQHEHPVFKGVKMPFNNGVTIAVARGSAAKAVFDGTVSQIVVMPGYNQCVLIQHGDYFTFYCKLKRVVVKAGDQVRTGQVIGTVDTINSEDQLHFQLWSGRNPQDPETWLRH